MVNLGLAEWHSFAVGKPLYLYLTYYLFYLYFSLRIHRATNRLEAASILLRVELQNSV